MQILVTFQTIIANLSPIFGTMALFTIVEELFQESRPNPNTTIALPISLDLNAS